MDKQVEFMRKLVRDLVEDARLHKTSMASIIGNGNFVAEQIMNDVYNQGRADAIEERASLLAYICKEYNIPLVDMNQTVDEWEEKGKENE